MQPPYYHIIHQQIPYFQHLENTPGDIAFLNPHKTEHFFQLSRHQVSFEIYVYLQLDNLFAHVL